MGSGAGQCSRWIRAPGRPRRTGWTSPSASSSTHGGSTSETGIAVPVGARHRHPPAVRRRLLRRRVLVVRRAAVHQRPRPGGRARPRGCCARAAGSRSRSPTRPAGCSPTTPARTGLIASQSYWDRTPYVEIDDATGVVAYVEHHRTLGDWVAVLAGHGFVDHRPARARVARGPRADLGRLVGRARAAHAGDGDLRRHHAGRSRETRESRSAAACALLCGAADDRPRTTAEDQDRTADEADQRDVRRGQVDAGRCCPRRRRRSRPPARR